MPMTTREALVEMMRRDLLRACRTLTGQRPGESVDDGKQCWVEVPISKEAWTAVYGPPAYDADILVVYAIFQWHGGKKVWELQWWSVVVLQFEGHRASLTKPCYLAFGSPVEWLEAADVEALGTK